MRRSPRCTLGVSSILIAYTALGCDPTDPREGPAIFTPIPPLSAHARIQNSFVAASDDRSTHEGQFTDGVDWNSPFTKDEALYIGSLSSAITPYTGHPAFATAGEAAIDSAHFKANVLSFFKLADSFSFGEDKKAGDLGFTIEILPPKDTFRGYLLLPTI